MLTTWQEVIYNITRDAKEKRIPVSGAFELTSRCNFQCKMCYVCQPASSKNIIRKERTASEWIRLAEEIRDAGALFLILTGGEVFLRPDFKEIYERISQMGYNVQLYTNASLVTPEIARWLGKIPPSRVSVTLYGASEETYERLCGVKSGFKKTLRGIELLRAEGISVEVKTTIVQGNIKDFDRIAAIVEDMGVKFGVVDYISPRREGTNSNPVGERLSSQEQYGFNQYFSEYVNRRMEQRSSDRLIRRNRDDFDVGEMLQSKQEQNRPEGNSEDPFTCMAGKSGFWVNWEGKLLPCGLMSQPAADPFENGFLPAWEKLKELCSTLRYGSECASCTIKDDCERCPGRLMTETGRCDRSAPYLCEIARLRAEKSSWQSVSGV